MAPTSRDENYLTRSIDRALGAKPGRQLRVGVGDDAALFVSAKGHETILTCDWFLEGTHFLRDKHPADAVGWKCLARAVSDIAAMGGVPKCFLLSLALPETHTGKWLGEFLGGLRRAAKQLGCALAGGDTTRTREILINVTVVGEVRVGHAILRSGARPGDLIYVSGQLGEAELGLRLLRRGKKKPDRNDPLLRKHLYPEPRLTLGRWLSEKRLATAMMDLSDGLSNDLPRLCVASRAGARVEMKRLPLVKIGSTRGTSKFDPGQLALHGGEDYELLFTVARSKAKRVPRSLGGVALTHIGEIMHQRAVQVIDESGREGRLKPFGWDPFRRAK